MSFSKNKFLRTGTICVYRRSTLQATEYLLTTDTIRALSVSNYCSDGNHAVIYYNNIINANFVPTMFHSFLFGRTRSEITRTAATLDSCSIRETRRWTRWARSKFIVVDERKFVVSWLTTIIKVTINFTRATS